jgi:hypothetical protein
MTNDTRTRLDCPDHRDHGRRSQSFFRPYFRQTAAAEQQAEALDRRPREQGRSGSVGNVSGGPEKTNGVEFVAAIT